MSLALRLGNLFGGRTATGSIGDGQLTLLQPAIDDFEEWRQLREESRDFLQPWEPAWPADDLTRRAFGRRVARYDAERTAGTGEAWFLRDRDGALLGGVALINMRGGASMTASLGYWMGRRHAGRGHMRRALGLLLPHAFRTHRLARIEAICLPGNERSIRLLQGAGFVREGLLRACLEIDGVRRDHLVFGLLERDCPPPVPAARR
jgi:ribosomal-protein-alanine N-acetyltransferase